MDNVNVFITPVPAVYLVSTNNTNVYNALSVNSDIVRSRRMKASKGGTDNGKSTKQETLSKRKETIERKGSVKDSESNREQNQRRKEAPVGILRLENVPKPRRSSPSEHRLLAQGEPPSPQPSIDRLSVTFAEDSVRSDSSTRYNLYIPSTPVDKMQLPTATDPEDSDEEDYSASVNAIIQRKASSRKSRKRGSRRASSPFSPDILPGTEGGRRRSSVFTTSSGDTAITVDDSLAAELTQEQIFENIKLHKEVLSSVRMQPWNMRKKLKLVMQAKNYVKKHEGALQERFTQTHSIKNILARWNIYMIKKWQHYRREMANLSNWLIPWEKRIKEIESHFGSVVASYFIFLRWLFWVNVVTSGVLIAFVAVPEVVASSFATDKNRKKILHEDKYNATNFLTLWDFEGVLKYSPLFYGWYTNKDGILIGYRLPLAYFMTELIVYVYSFVATLKKMAANSRMSKLSEKDDECIFTWKLFTGWDYMIGNPETAHNRVMSIVMSFKEALLEEAEKKRKERDWKIIWTRVFVNITVLGLFALSAAAVVFVVKRSTEPESISNIWRRNETTVVMTLISFIFPMILEFLGILERYHPRKQLRIQLARIMLLNLLNLYSLIFAQFDKISDMSEDLLKFKPNVTPIPEDPLTSLETISTVATLLTSPAENFNLMKCRKICFNVTSQTEEFTTADLITFITTSITTTALPKLLTSFNALNTTFTPFVNTTFTPFVNTTFTPFINTSTAPNGYDNYTFLSNETLFNFNDTNCCNDTDLNITMFDVAPDQPSESLFRYFKDTFQDYLSYILGDVNFDKSKDFDKGNKTEDLENLNNINFTTIWSKNSSYDRFKTTMAPVFTQAIEEWDERFEHELSTLYDEITSTVSWTNDIFSQTQALQECENRCETIFYTSSYTEPYTTTALTPTSDILDSSHWSYQNRTKLRSLCWETMFGQELVKLTVMDFVFTVAGIIGIDFIRGVFVRVMNKCWCWDLEKNFPEYGEFKVAENILHLVNNQGMVWMGMFFSPGLVVINVFKLMLLMYLRSWAVLTCNVPHAIIFRASRSNNFYFALLLTMLFLCVLPVGYAIVWVEPSWHCGPFSNNLRIFHILTRAIRRIVPKELHRSLDYVVSPGIVIPLLVLLILIIYYLISLTNSLREANADLKIQLRQERTEERRKMFQIADRRRRGGSGGSGDLENTPFAKWKKLIGTLPSGKSMDETPKAATPTALPDKDIAKPEVIKARDLMSKFIRRALRKPSVVSQDESIHIQDDAATDTEQPESLPEDVISLKEIKPPIKITSIKGKSVAMNGQPKKPEILHRESTESTEGKHVQIAETTPEVYRRNSQPKRDSIESKKNEDWKQRRQSPSRSTSSKDTRHDSITSNWSDNIPVITISKTESSECILEQQTEEANTSKLSKSEQNDDDKIDPKEEPKISSSSDTLVAEEQVFKPKIKHVLKKQTGVSDKDESSENVRKESSEHEGEETEDESTRTTVKSKAFEKTSTSDTTKSESSADYEDKSLS